MKVAYIGAQGAGNARAWPYVIQDATELVLQAGSACYRRSKGYTRKNYLKITWFACNFSAHAYAAPLQRNLEMLLYADHIVLFQSNKDTLLEATRLLCVRYQKPYTVIPALGRK